MRGTPLERFNSKYRVTDAGCWLWTATLNNVGYGHFGFGGGGKLVLAHRWAYLTFIGPIPEGLELDHTCNVRHCVNPAHLEPVTHAENQARAKERRRARRVAQVAA